MALLSGSVQAGGWEEGMENREKAGKGDGGRRKGQDGRMCGRGAGRRTAAALVLAVLAAALCMGCGTSKGSLLQDSFAGISNGQSAGAPMAGGAVYDAKSEAVAMPAEAAGESGEGASAELGVQAGRKLVKNVRLEVETKEFDEMMASLEAQVQGMGGYVEAMETYNGSSYSGRISSRYASLTIRIPSGRLEEFLLTVSDISNVVRRSDSVEDVTLSYVDMESRRDALRTEQDRLLEFMEQAGTIEDIIAIEQRLSEVRYQLESMESRLRALDNQIEYSTVYLDISEVKELTPAEEASVWKRIADGFTKSLRDVGRGAVELFVWFLSDIPYLVIWAAVIVCAVLAGKRIYRRRRRKKEKKPQESDQKKEGI